ncbi:MAG: glycosyl hydrolase [Acidobacteriota bacterium]
MTRFTVVRAALSMLLLWTATSAGASRPPGADAADFAAKEASWQRHQELDRASPFGGLEWRNIGPVVQGGRVVDIESVPGKPYSFLVAYASGGLWRTDDNGVNFEPLFDDQPTLIMGDLAVDPQNPDRIWVGTGENNSSRSSYGGLGVYRSDDGGDSWTHAGLGDSDRIGRILVDPRDSSRVYVGVAGRLYTPGGERGLYRTTDGGDTWDLVLDTGADGWTGIIDLVMDPSNPDVLYASAWHRQRRPWNFVEGGDGTGIYKTTDGGDTWTRLEGGLPRGDHVGRIGLALAASQPTTLYAAVDNQEQLPEEEWDLGDGAVTAKRLRSMTKEEFLAQDPESIEDFVRGNDLDTELDAESLIEMVKTDEITLEDLLNELDDANANLFNTDIRGLEVYRSDDGGKTWARTHDDPIREVVYTYGYYFGQIRVAPDDPDRIYCLGVPLITSDDGGKTWSGLNQPDVHVDHQAHWIDPEHPQRMVIGNDGGLDASYDGGKTWIKLDRQPVGQFYTVSIDMETPYNVYGGLQDNGSLKGSSRSKPGQDPWRFVGGGDGMHLEIDPRDGTLYSGFQFGFYFRAGPGAPPKMVRPRDKLKEPALRYNWQTPIRLSSHNPDILYFGANHLFRSMDQGDTWTAVSPDLTRSTERGDVPFGTLTTLSESTLRFGLIWVGTDDGQVHVTGDGGVSWNDVGDGLPADRWVSRVVASSHAEERAYVSLNGYRDDDIGAYVFATDDLGKTWSSIADGLPAEAVNVVREDPVNEDVLYVGTDRGVYTSLDRGKTWLALHAGLPNVPVHDLKVHPRDRELVAGTHGRSIYVIDALPIQELTAVQGEGVHVFPVENLTYDRGARGKRSQWFFRPEDAPRTQVPFWSDAAGKAVLTVKDAEGRALRSQEMDVERGVSTFSWDQILDGDLALAAEVAENAPEDEEPKKRRRKKKDEPAPKLEEGARAKTPWAEAVRLGWPLYATPGTYTLEVTVGEASASTELTVDPAAPRQPRAEPTPKIRGQKDDD